MKFSIIQPELAMSALSSGEAALDAPADEGLSGELLTLILIVV